MLIACYMVYRALDIKNSNFSKIKCFVVIILAIQNLIEYLNRNYIVFGIGIAILIIAYCVFYIGDGYIINFEAMFYRFIFIWLIWSTNLKYFFYSLSATYFTKSTVLVE